MKIKAVWTEELSEQFPDQRAENIQRFLELMDFLDNNDIENFLNEESIYSTDAFCTWMYSREKAEMNDMKRELMKKMARYRHIDEEQRNSLTDSIGKCSNDAIAGINFREEMKFYTVTIKKFYSICREYLKMEKRNDFAEDLSFCYPGIYFDDSVAASLRTLNRKFEEIQEEILEHLNALERYREKFVGMSERKTGYREIAWEFQKDCGIECSPQAGREGTTELKREFFNEVSMKKEEINCELHTKFKTFNIDRTKQDRIYFAPAREGIQGGRVIVVHIGRHL